MQCFFNRPHGHRDYSDPCLVDQVESILKEGGGGTGCWDSSGSPRPVTSTAATGQWLVCHATSSSPGGIVVRWSQSKYSMATCPIFKTFAANGWVTTTCGRDHPPRSGAF